MKKIIPGKLYRCTKSAIKVETEVLHRIPPRKLYKLVYGGCYHVADDGTLETPEGHAKITEAVADALKLHMTDEEAEYWSKTRDRAASDAMCAILGNYKCMALILEDKKITGKDVPVLVAQAALTYANTLVEVLEESPL